jgi:hypothetical protein
MCHYDYIILIRPCVTFARYTDFFLFDYLYHIFLFINIFCEHLFILRFGEYLQVEREGTECYRQSELHTFVRTTVWALKRIKDFIFFLLLLVSILHKSSVMILIELLSQELVHVTSFCVSSPFETKSRLVAFQMKFRVGGCGKKMCLPLNKVVWPARHALQSVQIGNSCRRKNQIRKENK